MMWPCLPACPQRRGADRAGGQIERDHRPIAAAFETPSAACDRPRPSKGAGGVGADAGRRVVIFASKVPIRGVVCDQLVGGKRAVRCGCSVGRHRCVKEEVRVFELPYSFVSAPNGGFVIAARRRQSGRPALQKSTGFSAEAETLAGRVKSIGPTRRRNRKWRVATPPKKTTLVAPIKRELFSPGVVAIC
jgi:hypothetical protein